MKKVAKLVTVTFISRVIVDDNASDEQVFEAARPQLKAEAEEQMFGNIDGIVLDTECPYHETIDGEEIQLFDVVNVSGVENVDDFKGSVCGFQGHDFVKVKHENGAIIACEGKRITYNV